MAGLAFLTRTIGVTLLAALIVSLIWEFRKQLLDILRKKGYLYFLSWFALSYFNFFKATWIKSLYRCDVKTV